MARKARICVPGALHHVTANVISGKYLFKDDEDKQKFIHYLDTYLKKTGFVLYSLNLYKSHYHMIIRINNLPLEALFRGFHTAYALYYNKKYGLSGYFFQNRPKTIPVEDGKESQTLLCYTNAGPIRAGLCKTLEDLDIFPYGSHSVINGSQKFPFLKKQDILSVFDSRPDSNPEELYREFMRQGLDNASNNGGDLLKLIKGANKEKQNMFEPGYWVIGSRKFVKDAIELDLLRRARVAQHKIFGWDQDNLAQHVCSITNVSLSDLRRRGRSDAISESRKLYCYFAIRVLDMTSISTALKLNITRTAVAYLARLGEEIARKKQLQLPQSPVQFESHF